MKFFELIFLCLGFSILAFLFGAMWIEDKYQEQLIETNYVIVNDGCLELWKQDEGKHYEIGRLCPDSTAPQTVYRFEIFPEYITLIEE